MTGSSAGANPYVGPRPFETGEQLFGRERELTELQYLLSAERIVLLHSPSGAGKSSLIAAGLIPRLRERFDVWRPTRVSHPVPDGVPAQTNRHVLSAVLGFEQGIPEDRRRPASELAGARLATYVAGRPRRPSAPENILLIFDQFEEVLTADPLAIDAKRAFFAQLGELLQNPQIWALCSLREDYLAPLDPYAQQVPTHLRNRYRIDLLGLEAAQQAIVGPSAERGRSWTEPAVDRLVRDLATVKLQQADGSFSEQVGLHVEPMQLQVVCRGLWDRMPIDDLSIDPEDVETFGDVTHALGGYYATEVARISADEPRGERALREWVGEALITKDGIRCPVLRTAGASEGLANALIERLVDAHLVRADHRGGAIWYELAHDRLVGPVRVDNERWAQANLQPVQVQAALWARQDRPATLLLSEEALTEVERWVASQPGPLGEPDQSFLAASRAARAQERAIREAQAQALRSAQDLAQAQARAAARQRTFTRLATVLALAAVVAAAVSYSQYKEAGEQTKRAEEATAKASEAKERAEEAAIRALDQSRIAASGATTDPTIQAVLLRELVRPTETNLWLQLVTDLRPRPIALAVLDHEDQDTAAAFSPDGARIVTVSADDTVRVRRVDGVGEPVVLRGHQGAVSSAVFSADGTRIVTIGADRTARVWRVDGVGEPVILQGPADEFVVASFSTDGSRVVTGSLDGTVRVWSSDGAGEPVVLTGHNGRILGAAFSPDGTEVVAIAEDGATRLWLIGGVAGPLVRKGRVGPDKLLSASVAFSSDGKRVAIAAADKIVWIWGVDGSGMFPLPWHDDIVHRASFSLDGTRVVTASADRIARVWDATRMNSTPVLLKGHEGGVLSAEFSPDGTRVVTTSEDGTARVWRADGSGLPAVLVGHEGRVTSASFSADGRRVMTTSGDRSAVWPVDGPGEPALRTGHEVAATPWGAASFSPDGTRVVMTAAGKTAQVWRTDGTGEPVVLAGHDGDVTGAAFSPDGRWVVTASKDRTARVWSADGDGEPVVLKGHDGEVRSAVFSPDGRRVLTTSKDRTARVFDLHLGRLQLLKDRTARVWDADNSGEAVELKGHTGESLLASFSADGTRVVTAAGDKTARVWRSDGTGEPMVYQGPVPEAGGPASNRPATGDDIDAAWLSPDGTRVLATLSDRTARIFGPGETVVLEGHADAIRMASFSADGGRVATASDDRTVRVWRVDGTGDPVVLAGHRDAVASAVFSADGTRVVTASADRTARVWQADGTGEPLVLTGHTGAVHWATFTRDGRRILTASEDHTVRVWTRSTPEEYVTYLWHATSYCLPESQRRRRLGATREEAATSVAACTARVAGYAGAGVYR